MAVFFRPEPLQTLLGMGLQYEINKFQFQDGGTELAIVLPPRPGRVGVVLSYTRGSGTSTFFSPDGLNSVPFPFAEWLVLPTAAYSWIVEGGLFADSPGSAHTLTVLDQWVAT